jgi:cell division protein FtsB
VRSLSEEETRVKKGQGLKIALAIVSSLFVVSLLANVYFYNRQYGVTPNGGLENQIADLQTQVSTLQNEKQSLQSQVSNLQNEIESLKSAKLVEVDLQAYDNRPWLQDSYLHVVGCIANVGTHTAYNCKLHVTLHQGEVIAGDTYISIGTISGEAWKSVDSRVYYEGGALSGYSVTPEWD